jgi:SAM-dependent methyltransferase
MGNAAENLIDIDAVGLGKVENIMDGYKKYHILKAGLELGIFDHLQQLGAASPDEISHVSGINKRYMPSLLKTLVDMDLIVQENNKFRNSDLASTILVTSSPNYQGDIVKMLENGGKWNNVKEKLTRTDSKKGYDSSGISWGTIASLSQRCLQGELQAVCQAIIEWEGFKQVKSILDIGGGHGLYVIALCQANPEANGLIFDQPHVVELTSKFVEKYNLQNRIKVEAGDISKQTPSGSHDIVITSHILYKFSRELPVMLNKICQSLKPGGLYVSNHWFDQTPALETNPQKPALEILDKLLNNPGHNICPLDEFTVHLRAAGLSPIKVADIPSSFGGSKLHLAVKNTQS